LAWVRSAGSVAPSLGLIGDPGEGVALDCHGWTSAAPTDSAVAVTLGSALGCHGGFVPVACDVELALACCKYVTP
jgi:hypothetical protein